MKLLKRVFSGVVLLVVIAMTVGCNKVTIIPDDELAMIFRDAFLVNSYMNNHPKSKQDSIMVYEPVFESYGYTMEDVKYTIGNFSRRKSAKLGDVVEVAIKMLEEQGEVYDREVEILDTINNVAQREFSRELLIDSAVRVASIRDTSKVVYRIAAGQAGEYSIDINYIIDSLDKNGALRGDLWFETSAGRRTHANNIYLQRNKDITFSRKFTVDSTARTLIIRPLKLDEKSKRPSYTLNSISVRFTPKADAVVDSLYQKQLNIRLFADEFFPQFETDSIQ